MMRKFIDIISEAVRPTRMKTATDDMNSFMPQVDIDHGGALAPAAQPASTSVAAPPISTASAATTRAAALNANIPADLRASAAQHGGSFLRDLERASGQAVTADELAASAAYMNPTPTVAGVAEPRPPENLPMVIQQAVMTGGDPDIDTSFNPDWHQVKNLPGNMLAAIRQMAGHVFREFTNTPTDDIQMMCDLLNPSSDVRKMAGWIVRNGVKQNEATIDFSETMPGYAAMAGLAECNLYNVEGYQFLVMRDRGGHYIYGWPADHDRMTDLRNQAQLPSS
jgi:hypothetical protein